MYDIHCHLLPGIDDGPPDLSMALRLARQSVGNGVTHAVVTPHVHPGRWENCRSNIDANIRTFREALAKEGIPLRIGAGAEVRVGPEIIALVDNKEIPFLGSWQGKKVMLVEMHHARILPGTDRFIAWLSDSNIVPLIAHPERNKEIMADHRKLFPLAEQGCLFQVTAGALVGQFGKRVKIRADKMLKERLITVLASDAHCVKRRPVNLNEGFKAAAAIIGEEQAYKLIYDNPKSIVDEQFST